MRKHLTFLAPLVLLTLAAGPAGAQDDKSGFKHALVVCMPGPSLNLIVDLDPGRTTLRIVYPRQKSTPRPLPGRCSFYRTIGALPGRDELTATESRRGSWRFECNTGRCQLDSRDPTPGIVGLTLAYLAGGQPVWFSVRYRPDSREDGTAEIVRVGLQPPRGGPRPGAR